MSLPYIFDTHCHFDLIGSNEEIITALNNARKNNIALMQTICTKISKFDFIKKFIEENDDVYGSVGIHPHETEKEKKVTIQELVDLANHPKIISIGETGLDYFYEHSNRDIQKESFRNHICAAREADLPVVVHTREADNDTFAIISDEMKKGAYKGLIHCFTSSKDLATKVLDLGFYISLSGIVTFKNSENLRETIRNIPLSKIIIETDAPYLAPTPMRGKKNEPAFLMHTAQYLADFYKISFNDFCKITTDNACTLFNINIIK